MSLAIRKGQKITVIINAGCSRTGLKVNLVEVERDLVVIMGMAEVGGGIAT